MVFSEADAGYKCTCPSRKFPCKHSLALMWMRAEGKAVFASAAVPDWVKDWLTETRAGCGGREGRGRRGCEAVDSVSGERGGGCCRSEDGSARGCGTRANRVEREAAILSGLEDLDVWLSDQVERGMATFVAQSAKECRAIAQRLVDAKAPGLATRMDALAASCLGCPSPIDRMRRSRSSDRYT